MYSDGEKASVDVAIIGGGCSGTLTAVHLVDQYVVDQLSTPLSVVIIDDSPRPARGVAYGTSCSEHLLNVSAKGMSGLARDSAHFVRWLEQRQPQCVPESFAPRMYYGDYLSELLEQARMAASGAVRLDVIKNLAESIEILDGRPRIKLASGPTLDAAQVVLALGNFPPESSYFASLIEPSLQDRFHDNPWQDKVFQAVCADDEILLIGTGLTMIDAVLQLRANGHTGLVHAISRHGYLPQPHLDLERLAAEKPTSYLPALMPSHLGSVIRVVRRAARAAELDSPGNWRCVMDELRQVTASIWQQMTNEDRSRFLRHVRQLWEVHRHRMAPEIALQMKELVDAGVLHVSAGRVVQFGPAADTIEVSIKPRGSSTTRRILANHVINCTGPKTDFRSVGDPLIQQLRSSGILQADELGLGASVDLDGALLNHAGQRSDCLYAIASLRKGLLWETTAVPEIRQQASDMAALLLRKLCPEHEQRSATAATGS